MTHFCEFRSDVLLHLHERSFIGSSNTILDVDAYRVIIGHVVALFFNTTICSNVNFLNVASSFLDVATLQVLHTSLRVRRCIEIVGLSELWLNLLLFFLHLHVHIVPLHQ